MRAKRDSVDRLVRCSLCHKTKGDHKAVSLHCPVGMKTRVGYVQFSATDTYTPNNKAHFSEVSDSERRIK